MEVPLPAILLTFILPAVTASKSAASHKPACDSSTKGLYWPEAANHDSRALQHYARAGVLERCVSGPWHHRWQALTVSAKAAAEKDNRRQEQAKK